MSVKIVLYSKSHCPYCVYAANLLNDLNLSFEEVKLKNDYEAIQALVERTGMRTLPQIFINDQLIGGYDDLKGLHDSGELSKMVS
ncbi:glutathione S-transferase N-terminal domain-containing protein [Candidatus Comchoanobacter bicostacola]|uniref:Glutathione S-transferase N-terminal domain-containing protein n=1 Tax=Candidatus Comchoanobacter bicostacola TaxID=2919598 RepID=A0ABY5DIH5_9GAMM|nr:glutaredoxin domain-containing protein [Candidatus Comchoanobacter bicostacola]UTC24095.1 glutathione S-transferase N-terminal domain-containing protein [Candidatus Comchoanobacter bicostacola]